MENAKDPMYAVKESLLAMAESCDTTKPVPAMCVQATDQSIGVMLHVLELRALPKSMGKGPTTPVNGGFVPLIVVRYTFNSAASMSPAMMASVQAGLEMLPEGTLMQNIPDEVPAVELLHTLLKKNAKHLSPSFLQSAKKHLPDDRWHLSTLQPLFEARVVQTPSQPCPNCRHLRATRTCSRCKVERYCSKDCQQAHWEVHKKTCEPPEMDDLYSQEAALDS